MRPTNQGVQNMVEDPRPPQPKKKKNNNPVHGTVFLPVKIKKNPWERIFVVSLVFPKKKLHGLFFSKFHRESKIFTVYFWGFFTDWRYIFPGRKLIIFRRGNFWRVHYFYSYRPNDAILFLLFVCNFAIFPLSKLL